MKIAITGTIGSGKSAVSSYLREKGYYVFDCDKENDKLLKTDVLKPYFKDCYDDNILNKKKLASLIFDNKKAKTLLESIMHPLILKKMVEKSRQYDPFFAEVPLLFEVNWDKYFDHTLLVVADKSILINRLLKRGLNLKESEQRFKNQMSIKDKIARSDTIIYNNSSLFSLHKKIDRWLLTNAW